MTGNIRRGLTRMQGLARIELARIHHDKWPRRELQCVI